MAFLVEARLGDISPRDPNAAVSVQDGIRGSHTLRDGFDDSGERVTCIALDSVA